MMKLMSRQRHDSIVQPERRSRTRVLTLKNFGIVLAVAVVVFIAISIRSEMRGRGVPGYGRLVNKGFPQDDVKVAPREVITEAPAIDDRQSADPMLTSAAAREQYLRGAEPTPLVPVPVAPPARASVVPPVRRGEGDVAIVGGADGVAVVKTDSAAPPKLSGGIFRPQ
jgi:hypothetical protein